MYICLSYVVRVVGDLYCIVGFTTDWLCLFGFYKLIRCQVVCHENSIIAWLILKTRLESRKQDRHYNFEEKRLSTFTIQIHLRDLHVHDLLTN